MLKRNQKSLDQVPCQWYVELDLTAVPMTRWRNDDPFKILNQKLNQLTKTWLPTWSQSFGHQISEIKVHVNDNDTLQILIIVPHYQPKIGDDFKLHQLVNQYFNVNQTAIQQINRAFQVMMKNPVLIAELPDKYSSRYLGALDPTFSYKDAKYNYNMLIAHLDNDGQDWFNQNFDNVYNI